MRITVLGSGTSHGVPVIGCSCAVCRSNDPRNRRTRASVMVKTGEGQVILFDTATEFRLQAVREGIERVDGVFYTHAHADHIHGLDDLRPLSWKGEIPLYGNQPTIDEIAQRFSYIFRQSQEGGGKPRVSLHTIEPAELLRFGGIEILPVPLLHGELPVLGYRIGPFAYLTDCSAIPESSYQLLEGVEYLIIDALRPRPHPTHFSFDQATAESRRIGAKQTWFTHLCHDVDHREMEKSFPAGISPAWDGLSFTC